MEFVSSLIVLKPGMYILRHPNDSAIPLMIGLGPGVLVNSGKFETLGTPATNSNCLRTGADCIVAHVYDGDVELLVTACLPDKSIPVPALRLDRIGLDGEVVPQVNNSGTQEKTYHTANSTTHKLPTYTSYSNQALSSVELRNSGNNVLEMATANVSRTLANQTTFNIAERGLTLIGHIENLGDKLASPGELLIGDKKRDLRLEGFQLNWPDKPVGIDLSYSVEIEGVGARQQVTLGNFCGSRGNARRIISVKFDLLGSKSSDYELRGWAVFSGGFRVPLSSGISISGPSGFEHLTGLQLSVVRIAGAA